MTGTFVSDVPGTKRKLIAIYGGTFDPFHLGHRAMVEGILRCLAPTELRLVPCAQPPHRDEPTVAAKHRYQMCMMATSHYPAVMVDDCEMIREEKSYTVDTLRHFRQVLGEQVALVFCVGRDAFAGMDAWSRAGEISRYAHIAVLPRALGENGGRDETAPACLRHCPVEPAIALQAADSGFLTYLDIPLYPVSSTEVRERITRVSTPEADEVLKTLLPGEVLDYIHRHRLYH